MRFPVRAVCALSLSLGVGFTQAPQAKAAKFPYPEKLSYRVEWRMINAGSAHVQLSREQPDRWSVNLRIESAGLVTRLYRVLDLYQAVMRDHFCAVSSLMDAEEGKRHVVTRLTFDNTQHKVLDEERDVTKNSTSKSQLAIAPCTYEIIGALIELRVSDLQPGRSLSLPITNGKRMPYARIDGLDKENVTVDGKTYSTIRYEAYLFDNVLFKRKGRLFIWMTDNPERIPVQFRVQLGFPIGTVSVELEKEEKLGD